MLMAAKVQKPGAVFLMGLITALIYFATGQFTLVILISMASTCILAEVARGVTKYNSFKGNSIAYVIFSLGMVGSPLPIWLFKADFLAQITEQGMPADYVSAVEALSSNASMVFQNVYLFRDTIRNNIKFGSPDATEEQIIAAAKKARCHSFIMALPDGYDTMIGEGGSSLSGGEKQRISIARAMLKDAPIVILDEATASIDPENEHLIQEALSALTHGKTIITIAHRLATIENADQILVIDEGTVIQKGTHKELLEQEGTYKEFIKIREQAEGWRIQ